MHRVQRFPENVPAILLGCLQSIHSRYPAKWVIRLAQSLSEPFPESRSPRWKNSHAALPGISGFCWRGAIEQSAVPAPHHGMHHRHGNRRRTGNEHNRWGNRGNRRRRMHHHAERAMIRIGGRRMDVRHLHQRNQGQQQYTQQRRRPHGPGPAVANPSLLSTQIQRNSSLIQEYTEIRRRDPHNCCSKKNATACCDLIS